MKKIISIVLILLVILSVTNVYASSCKVTLSTPKTDLAKNEEFTVDVSISDIDDEKGIMALMSTLEYDKDSLELVKMEQQNGWAKPEYNEENGKFVQEKGDFIKSKETTLKVTFKVKEDSKSDVKISLKSTSTSNGDIDIKPSDSSISLKVTGDSKPTPTPTGTPTPTPKPSENSTKNENQNKNTNKNTSKNIISSTNNPGSLKSGSLPKAGTTSVVLSVILVLIVIALIFYARIRKMDKDGSGR